MLCAHKSFYMLCAIVLVWAFAGCGEETLATKTRAIINGETDPSDAHLAVVAILAQGGLCSGTLITPDWVMTAGHCIGSFQATDYQVLVSRESISKPMFRLSVAEVVRHPAFDLEKISNDIALLRLSAPAPAVVRPIPYLPNAVGIGADDVGAPLEFVGFGKTETGVIGRKYHVVGEVRWICTDSLGCQFITQDEWGVPNTLCYNQVPGGPCAGDSGGPALFTHDGRVYVAGVTSYGSRDDCTVFGCSTKVDAHTPFLNEHAGTGLGKPCVGDADCTMGLCREGICCSSTCSETCRSCSEPGLEGNCVKAANGSTCDDGEPCNGAGVCVQGACYPNSGAEPAADGTPCGDCRSCSGGVCIDLHCDEGSCAASGPVGALGLPAALALVAFALWLSKASPRRSH